MYVYNFYSLLLFSKKRSTTFKSEKEINLEKDITKVTITNLLFFLIIRFYHFIHVFKRKICCVWINRQNWK
jgi:hypothetical protein